MGGILGDVLGFIGAGRAGRAVSNANIAAEHGVLGATGGGQQAVEGAIYDTGAPLYSTALAATQPYINAGLQGTAALQNYAASNPQFNFDPSKYFNSPGYQFQLQQGTNAITNAASAMGLGASGNTLRDLTTFGQGLAANYYNQAFGQAQQQFQTNQNATLQNLGALIGTGQFGTQQQGVLSNAAANFFTGGNEYLGNLGLQGATTAGNFAVNAGLANASGIMGQYNNLGALGRDVGGLVAGLGF